MTNGNEGTTGDLAANLAALRQDVARLVDTISGTRATSDTSCRHRVSEAVGDVKDRIASTATDAQSRVRSASGEIEAYIERNPLTAVLIALGVGMSLGLFTRPRG